MAVWRVCCALILTIVLQPGNAGAQQLPRFLDTTPVAELMPEADEYGAVQGRPPAAPIYKDGELAGYALLTTDLVNAAGYSGKPIHILVGLDLDGVVTGVKLVEHSEPIVLIGIPESRIRAVLDGYIGRNIVRETVEEVGLAELDIVAGATVTIMVIDDSIRRASLKLARSRGFAGVEKAASTDRRARIADVAPERRDWQSLLGDGSVRRLTLMVGEVNRAFEQAGYAEAAARPESDVPGDTFIDLYVAQVSVPTIGRSLLGDSEFALLEDRLSTEQSAILVAANGLYSFKGSGYVRGGVFDRIQLVQEDSAIRFRDRNHKRLGDIAAEGAPDFTEIALFRLPEDVTFDPAVPWRLDLLVSREVRPGDKSFISFDLRYRLPDRYLVTTPRAVRQRVRARDQAGAVGGAEADALEERRARDVLWQRVWRGSWPQIVVLGGLLGVLTGVFYFQDQLVKRQRLMSWIRYGFLTMVLFWLGFWMNAQLSVVNVFTFANALITDFSWGYFLMAPLIFILWVGVVAGMLFWGRGVFCGWLCPYGALQELTNHIGRRLGIRQIELPWGLNERLWTLKYIIFIALFGASLYSMTLAERMAEVEPFKTAIIMNFARSWPYVAWAGGLLVVGLFIERFFCRYLCPLGAALAIPAKLRMFDWLKRYKECGNPCQRCADICPTAAIHPDGRINVNECIYCLDCQKLYYDDQRCPHMIELREKRERRLLRSSDSALSAQQLLEKRMLQAKKQDADKRAGGAGSSRSPSTSTSSTSPKGASDVQDENP